MDKNDVAERIRVLVAAGNRPEAAKLRDIFDDVEVALKARVPQADVLAELHKLGFKMTLGGFKSALQRIRKERKKTGEITSKLEKTDSRKVNLDTTAGKTSGEVTAESRKKTDHIINDEKDQISVEDMLKPVENFGKKKLIKPEGM